MMGSLMISEPVEIAAAYPFCLCSNHPFVDGNNRMAIATCLVILCENGLLPNEDLDVDAWESLTLAVAASLLSREVITATLRMLLA